MVGLALAYTIFSSEGIVGVWPLVLADSPIAPMGPSRTVRPACFGVFGLLIGELLFLATV